MTTAPTGVPTRVTLCLLLLAGPVSALDPDQVSRTAIGVSCSRAFMARASDPKVRNPDYLAEKLLDDELKSLVPESCADLDRPFEEVYQERMNGPAAYNTLGMVVRTRHIDAALEASLTRGVEQVVILGAGLDSRAYRMRDEHPGVRFFEVDSPATQQDKKERVEQLFGSLPLQVVYVPVDFETQSLEERLAEAGFSAKEPSFFVWEGVTMYLNAEAVHATLAFVAENSPAGSEIVFDYVYAGVIDGTYGEPPAARTRRLKRLEAWGEPWLFGIPQGQTAEFIEQRGLELVSDFSVRELFEKYLGPQVAPSVAGQDRGLSMAVARVGQ